MKGGYSEPLTIDVSVKLVDGTLLRGSLVAGITGQLENTLNRDTPFIEFLGQDGRRVFLAKQQIASVEPLEPLRKPQLGGRKGAGASALEVLGLDEGCSFDEVKSVYHRIVKSYHPDLYAGAHFPPEIVRYATDMFTQASAAFAEIRQSQGAAVA